MVLYSDKSNLGQLQELTTRFQDRFLELPYDQDAAVAVSGLELLAVLLAGDQMPAADVERFHELLLDDSAAIRRAAAAVAVEVSGALAPLVRGPAADRFHVGPGRSSGAPALSMWARPRRPGCRQGARGASFVGSQALTCP